MYITKLWPEWKNQHQLLYFYYNNMIIQECVVYLWHLICIPYEVMPIQFFWDWLPTYISNSRVHIFICMNTLVLIIIMNKWKDANICYNITPTTYLLVHFQFQSKCNRSPLYCWEKKKYMMLLLGILHWMYFKFSLFYVYLFIYFFFAFFVLILFCRTQWYRDLCILQTDS